MEIDATDGPSSIQLTSSEELTVRLAENPTTGYRWRLDPESLGDVLTPLGSSYEQGGPGIGAAGVRTFRFAASQSGTAKISLSLTRAWETDAALDHYDLAVTVEDGQQ